MNRECGECTACCEGWIESARMEMKPGVPCRQLVGGGCSIYAQRPENPCRNFNCGWKIPNSPLPDEMRPDQCGAIVVLGQDWRHWRVIRAVPVGWTIPDETLRRIKHFAVVQRMALIYHEFEHIDGAYSRTQRIGFGPPDFVKSFREALIKEGAEELETRGS
ncbi:MAG TPA: hypothetical protein VKN35_02155 [Xanthomonadales bacterium]|nr:hypothetical protein [Xanthomonadales bacterium]